MVLGSSKYPHFENYWFPEVFLGFGNFKMHSWGILEFEILKVAKIEKY